MNAPTDTKHATPLCAASPTIQTHLQILQSVINRMATNSASCKTWCITLVSAVLVIVADKGKANFALLAFLPTLLFFALDAYYLSLEKAYRASYNQFVERLHAQQATSADLYVVAPHGDLSQHQVAAIFSVSVWGFYSFLSVLIVATRSLVL